ncbi:MAG: hypothetical protein R3324_20385, partial [Halobacteriales archaeon]|nr:hypothetical protein [Halobacteriales archaeon]
MSGDKLPRFKRRQYLKAGGAALGGIALAGCTGDGGDGGDGEATPTASPMGTPTPTAAPEMGIGHQRYSADFPSKELTVLIASGPGGGFDAYGRMTARWLEEKYVDVPVKATNVGGFEGAVAAEQLDNRLGWDDHTMGIWNCKDLLQIQVHEDVNYDMRDWTWYPRITVDDDLIAAATHTGLEAGDYEEWATMMENGELTIAAIGGRSTALVVLGLATGRWEPSLVAENTVGYGSAAEII